MRQEGSSFNDLTSSTPTITVGHAGSRTGQNQGIPESPIIKQTTDENDDECKINFHSNMDNYQNSCTNQVYIIDLPNYYDFVVK